MGVRLRTTLTATAAVAAALCLAAVALFSALSASLADSTKELALQDAKARAEARGFVVEKGVGDGTGGMVPPGLPLGVPDPAAGGGGSPDPAPGGPPDPAPAPKSGTGAKSEAGTDTVSGPETGTVPAPGGKGQVAGSTGKESAGSSTTGASTGTSAASTSTGASAGSTSSGTSAASTPAPKPPAGKPYAWNTEKFVSAKGVDGKLEITQIYPTKNGPVVVKGTASMAPARQAMKTLTLVLVPGVPALLALVALFTWLAVGRALRPVSAIRAKVAEITAHGLHERVPEPRTRDEIAALARTVNATLDRLRTAVDAHRQFVADAAHELRSPMAVLRTRLELARPAEKELAAEALDDVGRLQSLTSDLLLLARLDARQPLRAEQLDLAQLVAEEAARKRPRLEIRVALHLAPDVLVHGSADHLRRLVANLVDNAVRHATTTVSVTLTRRAGQALLDVADDGDGIPPEHRATVFDRFTRLDAARPRDTGGSGLGLPIARDIAAAHGATLGVLDTPPGSGAHLRAVFPLADQPFGWEPRPGADAVQYAGANVRAPA